MKIRLTWVVLALSGYFFVIDVAKDIAEGETLSQWGLEALVFTAIVVALCDEIYSSYRLGKKLDLKET